MMLDMMLDRLLEDSRILVGDGSVKAARTSYHFGTEYQAKSNACFYHLRVIASAEG
jgi:hypothetical protein